MSMHIGPEYEVVGYGKDKYGNTIATIKNPVTGTVMDVQLEGGPPGPDYSNYVIQGNHPLFTVFVGPRGNHYVIRDNDDAEILFEGYNLMDMWVQAVHKVKVKRDYAAAEGAPALKDGAL